ncbi:MAG: phosphatidate cytidylyltransferase, partial [Sphingobacteriales bacterium]
LINILCLSEYFTLLKNKGIAHYRLIGLVSGALFYTFFMMAVLTENMNYLAGTILLVFAPLLAALFDKRTKNPIPALASTSASLVFIALPISLITLIGFKEPIYNGALVFGIICFFWVNDTMAYLTGRLIGRRKLMERISPGKTIEGTLGGLVFTLIFAYFVSGRLSGYLNATEWATVAAISVVFGNIGDLSESFFKRHVGAKDSGNLLPGHGGFLDRFDSVIGASPFIFIYLYLFS